jgi:hypothetical protein
MLQQIPQMGQAYVTYPQQCSCSGANAEGTITEVTMAGGMIMIAAQ